jgi:hypothetical protein
LGRYPAKSLNLFDIIGKHGRLGPLMVTVEFREIIHLDIILDAISEAGF